MNREFNNDNIECEETFKWYERVVRQQNVPGKAILST